MMRDAFTSLTIVLSTLGMARIAVTAPAQAEAGGNEVNLTLVTLVTIAALAAAVIVGGLLIAAIAAGVTRFLGKNMPPAEVIAQLDKQQIASVSQPRKAVKVSPNWEPFVIAAGGFVVVYILAALFVRPAGETPAASASNTGAAGGESQNQAAPAATMSALPTTGDFEQIVANLPAGDADSGVKLFASIGCNACHSLQKDQRLVGPSFYGLWTRAGTREPGRSARAYLYESIVQPNKFIVEGYQPNLMPPNYAAVLSVQQMADILAYIERDHAEQ
jgi:cytochrome c2